MKQGKPMRNKQKMMMNTARSDKQADRMGVL